MNGARRRCPRSRPSATSRCLNTRFAQMKVSPCEFNLRHFHIGAPRSRRKTTSTFRETSNGSFLILRCFHRHVSVQRDVVCPATAGFGHCVRPNTKVRRGRWAGRRQPPPPGGVLMSRKSQFRGSVVPRSPACLVSRAMVVCSAARCWRQVALSARECRIDRITRSTF